MSWEKAIKLAGLSLVAGLVTTSLVAVVKPHPVVGLAINAGGQLAAFRFFGGV